MQIRAAVLTLAALGIVAPSAGAAGQPILPLDAVQPGMNCTSKSVIRGTDIVTFGARIDDVLRDGKDSRKARLLVTVSGAAVDGTGVGQGFSGSPVICTGADGVERIAGAISETIGSYGGKTVLATPIQAILGEPVDPPKQGAATANASALLKAARPIATPISVGGFSPAVGAMLQRAARRAGRTVFLSASPGASAAQAPVPALQPGSAVALGYATGDITAGAVGTVAYTDGDAVWALGHPFEGAGRRELFLQNAYVYGIVNNPLAAGDNATYKLAAPTGAIGALRQDGNDAVVGRVGATPASYRLRVTARDRDTSRLHSIVARITDERALGYPVGYSALSSLLTPVAVDSIQGALRGSPIRQSADMCVRLRIKQRRKGLGFCNRYVGGGGDAEALAGSPLAADLGQATAILDAYDATSLDVTSVEVGIRVRRGLALATIVRLSGPRSVRRGSVLNVRAHLRRPGGGRVTRTIKVPIPRTMRPGARDVLLRGSAADVEPGEESSGDTLDLTGLFDQSTGEAPPTPTSVSALARAFTKIHSYDGVRARILPRGASEPSELPGGTERFAQRSRRVYRDDALRIDGRARFKVQVR